MDAINVPQSPHPSHHSKVLHLVRHAQAIHNEAAEKDRSALLSPEYFDAQLSPLGWQQVHNLRKQLHLSGLFEQVDLVITSPLLRAMQTAVGLWATQPTVGEFDDQSHTVENDGSRERSSFGCPPIVAAELCRERLGVHPSDKRRTISEYKSLFPAINFSLIESDDDILWKADVRENPKEVAARGFEFMNWLLTRPEREIAVVTHNRFLQYTLTALASHFQPSVAPTMCKEFRNCELRSIAIVDKRNDLSSDDAKGKQLPGDCPTIFWPL